jgi:competence protein ComEC
MAQIENNDVAREMNPAMNLRGQPMLVASFALTGGILADRYLHIGFGYALAMSIFCLTCWIVIAVVRHPRISAWLLVLAIFGLGAAWHHYFWNLFAQDEIGLCCQAEAKPVCFQAIATTQPHRIPAPEPSPLDAFERGEASRLTVRAIAIRNGRKWQNVSGRVSMYVDGVLADIRPGDRLEIFGYISSPQKPMNPGEFDFYLQQRTERCLARVTAREESVQVLQHSRFHWDQPMEWLRARLDRFLWEYIDHDRAPLASAILLGNRDQIETSDREQFMETGTVHLLAISGLHVGILASTILLLGRIGWLPRGGALIGTILFVFLYAWLVEFRPPVTRAAILITLYCLGKLIGREPLSFNSLALAAFLVLGVNPAELFRTGAQLSFLAVAAIVVCSSHFFQAPSDDPLDRLIAQSRPMPVKFLRGSGKLVWRTFAVSFAIWIVTLPLVASRFHIVAPIGCLLNPLLMLPIWLALISGFLVLLTGGVLPPLAAVFGRVCDWSLSWIQAAIQQTADWPGAHWWLAGPNDFWLAVFYLTLASTYLLLLFRMKGRWLFAFLLGWYAATLFLPAFPQRVEPAAWIGQLEADGRIDWLQSSDPELVVTAISVGHGTSLLIEYPNGKTLLYDGGSLTSPSSATRKISGVLWHKRIERLDAILITHADADHYNGIPDLLKKFPTSTVIVSPAMFADAHGPLVFLRDSIEQSSAKLQTVLGGDELLLDPQIRTRVLEPAWIQPDISDNAQSIVLAIEPFGRRVLLPGDLEGQGMQRLLARLPLDCDVVMSPHHGSASSEQADFAQWSSPEIVLISSDKQQLSSEIQDAYRHALIYNTANCGAIEFRISASHISVQKFVDEGLQP